MTLAVVLFGLLVRSVGMLAAVVLAAMVGAAASRHFAWPRAVPFALALSALCTVVFVGLLGLSIPVDPWPCAP